MKKRDEANVEEKKLKKLKKLKGSGTKCAQN